MPADVITQAGKILKSVGAILPDARAPSGKTARPSFMPAEYLHAVSLNLDQGPRIRGIAEIAFLFQEREGEASAEPG